MVALNSTIAFLFSSWSYFYGHDDELTVSTSYGRLEGTQAESRAGRSYYEFLGVPFAKPPVGTLRFASPQPPDPWEGVRTAKSNPYECIQYHIGRRVTGDEDCLYLNVFTHRIQSVSGNNSSESVSEPPSTSTEASHPPTGAPVIVYLHGGIFMFGGARIYGARYFLDHDIVLVVVQYRLGALGFLNTGDDGVVRGNMALKDQVLALQWVRDNIHAFGGDPTRVTLVGQSAGAVCAHLHTLSPLSRGLFQQVVLQSGNALAPWGMKARPEEQARRFGARLGCLDENSTNSTEEMVACLRNLDATTLVQGHDDFPYQLYDRLVIFGPTVETGGENGTDTETFLDDDPLNLIRSNRGMNLPMMQGVNAVEGLLFAATMIKNETVRSVMAANWTAYAPKFLGLEDHPRRGELVELIGAYYLGANETSAGGGPDLTMEALLNMTDMLSDRNFFQPAHWLAEWNLEQQNEVVGGGGEAGGDGGAPAAAALDQTVTPTPTPTPTTVAPMFLYFYTYKGEFSVANFVLQLTRRLPQLLDVIVSTGMQWVSTKILGYEPQHYGAGHADEIFMLFKVPILTQHEEGTKDYEMSRALVETWVTFAATGRPKVGGGGAEGAPTCWEPVGKLCPTDAATTNHNNGGFQYMRLDNVSKVIEEPFKARLDFWESLGLNEKI